MILVAGESLMDLIVGPQGDVHAAAGGGPFNTARTIARLGQPVRFLGRFSADPFGALLAGKLAADQVELELPGQVAEPTALAIVSLDDAGVARYWFHLIGTAGFVLDRQSAARALRKDVTALHVGTLGLVVEPMAAAVEDLARQLPEPVLLMLDPNWRASAIPDASAQLDRIRRLLLRTDILKTSSEDLAFLVPGRDLPAAARDAARLGRAVCPGHRRPGAGSGVHPGRPAAHRASAARRGGGHGWGRRCLRRRLPGLVG